MADIVEIYDDSGEVKLVKIVNQMVFVRNETPFSAADENTFETRYSFVENTLIVCLNGLRQREGEGFDYVVKEGNQSFCFNYEIEDEDSVIVDYIKII
jgi:hypothetical protein